jgi:hypothetical protein
MAITSTSTMKTEDGSTVVIEHEWGNTTTLTLIDRLGAEVGVTLTNEEVELLREELR